jgi:hypothetical protein
MIRRTRRYPAKTVHFTAPEDLVSNQVLGDRKLSNGIHCWRPCAATRATRHWAQWLSLFAPKKRSPEIHFLVRHSDSSRSTYCLSKSKTFFRKVSIVRSASGLLARRVTD